jgi:hypothetical protein
MKIIDVASEPNIAAGYYYPDSAGWDLTADCRVSYGQDGEDGDWIVYVATPGDADDLYVKVSREQIVEHARQILIVTGEKAWP